MSRFGLRTRLTVLVGLAAAFTLAGLTVGFNLLLRSNLNGDANRVLEARASAALDGISEHDGTLQARESPEQRRARHPGVGLQRRHRDRPSYRPARSVQQLADSLAGGPRTRADDANADLRLFAVPVVQDGKRAGTIVTAISLDPYEHSSSRALTGVTDLRRGRPSSLVLLATRLIVNPRLAPGGSDDQRGGRLERARPRASLQRRRALRRAHEPRRDLRQHARPPCVGAAPRAAALGRASHTSCARRSRRSSPRPSWRSANSAEMPSTDRRSRRSPSVPPRWARRWRL